MADNNHVQHIRLKINYIMYVHNRVDAIKKLLGNDTVVVLITESDIITNDDCIVVDVDYIKVSDVLVGENGCIRYVHKNELKKLVPNKNRYVGILWNRLKDGSNYTYKTLNVLCLMDIPQPQYDMMLSNEQTYFPVKVEKVLGQSTINNFDGGNTALGYLYRDILYFAELVQDGNRRQTNAIDSWILPNGLFQKTAIAHNLLSVRYLQSRRDDSIGGKDMDVPDVASEQPIIMDMLKVLEDRLGYPLRYASCELLDARKTFKKDTVYVLNSSMIPLVNRRRGCLVKWNKRHGIDTLYWLEGLGGIMLNLRE